MKMARKARLLIARIQEKRRSFWWYRVERFIFNERGCFGGSPSSPPLPTPAPQQAQGDAQLAEMAEQKRRRAAASNTTLTSPLGVTNPAATQQKTLLGS